MEDNHLITIFITTYNRADYLKECIESVLNQTYRDFGLFILDNASTDNTNDIVNMFKDERIKYIKHPENIGAVSNGNYAIRICETKYFMIFHDDDIMEPNLVELELAEMESHEEYAIVSSQANYINSKSEVIKTKIISSEEGNSKKCYRKNEYLIRFLNGSGGVNCPSVMYRNSFFKEHNLLFQSYVGPSGDQFMWFEVENADGVICCINKNLMRYRLHEEQDSNLNSDTMLVDLYRALNNSEKYKATLSKYRYINENMFLRKAINIGQKYAEHKITSDVYIKYMDIITHEICSRQWIVSILNLVKFISINFPDMYVFTFNALRKFKRSIMHQYNTLENYLH